MRTKRVEWRPRAQIDASESAEWYLRNAGITLGERFLTQVEATLARLSEFPEMGSTRHAWCVPDLSAPLRFFPVTDFERHLVYYLALEDRIEVIRIWNAARGLDALMSAE